MTAINIQTITGINFPYTIYACDVYGNQCTLIATLVTSVPPEKIIILPSQFDSVAAVGIKVIDGNNCERFEVVYCNLLPPVPKQFQDYEYFEFMDFEIFDFQ
jgi:hypothetical protein